MLVLGKETKEGAEGGDFVRVRPRTTFASSEHSFSLRSFKAVCASQVAIMYEESTQK